MHQKSHTSRHLLSWPPLVLWIALYSNTDKSFGFIDVEELQACSVKAASIDTIELLWKGEIMALLWIDKVLPYCHNANFLFFLHSFGQNSGIITGKKQMPLCVLPATNFITPTADNLKSSSCRKAAVTAFIQASAYQHHHIIIPPTDLPRGETSQALQRWWGTVKEQS